MQVSCRWVKILNYSMPELSLGLHYEGSFSKPRFGRGLLEVESLASRFCGFTTFSMFSHLPSV